MKNVGKPTRPFRYDLNQTPYDYTVKVTNRFKGFDLIDRVPEEQWMEGHDTVQKAMAPHSSTLAWKIPWTKDPGRLQSMGSLRVGHD